MSIIFVDRDVVHYEVLGRGAPVVFLHGWVGSWRYWAPAMQAASARHRAYALDLWGFGDSTKDPARYSLDQQISLLSYFIREMGIERVALVGHGLGAQVALRYALAHTNEVERVMAVAYPLESTHFHPRLSSSSPVQLADWLLSRDPSVRPVRLEAEKTDPRAVSASMESASLSPFTRLWAGAITPCLLVNGLYDPALATRMGYNHSTFPVQTQFICFNESGHFPMLDESSKFIRLMMNFLSLPTGVSPRALQLKEEWKRRIR